MRIKKSISKNNSITYSIIRDYTTSSGKRSTCIYESLGNMDSLIKRFGSENTMDKVQEYIDSLNQMVKDVKNRLCM